MQRHICYLAVGHDSEVALRAPRHTNNSKQCRIAKGRILTFPISPQSGGLRAWAPKDYADDNLTTLSDARERLLAFYFPARLRFCSERLSDGRSRSSGRTSSAIAIS